LGRSITKNFTEGNVPKQLLFFTLPFMLSNALQVFYSTIDMMVVGNFVGTAGLSAVSQSSQIVNFATMFCFGISNAGQVLVSQAIGSGKREKLNSIIGTLFSLLMMITVLLSVLVILFRNDILSVINVPDESFQMGIEYLVICMCGLVFTTGYNMVSAILRGMGDSKRPLLFIFIASVVNLVLDLLFTGFLGFGVAGAAYATIIGQAVSFIYAAFYLYKRKEEFGFDFKFKSLAINRNHASMIVKIGTPMAVQSGFIHISMLYVNSLINDISVVASATFGVGMRIDDIINKLSLGIQHAAIPMISQNIGAGKKDRAKKIVYYAIIYSLGMTIFFMALYFFFGKELFMLFSDDPLVHEMSGTFIKGILWLFPALAVMRGSGAFIQGIGHARLSMILALLDGVVLRIGFTYLFGIVLDLGFYGFVVGYALGPYGFAIPSIIYFLSGVWKKRKTLAEEL